MIRVTRLNEAELFINSELIEFIEATPDTTITMTTGRKVIVKETVRQVIDEVSEFKRSIGRAAER